MGQQERKEDLLEDRRQARKQAGLSDEAEDGLQTPPRTPSPQLPEGSGVGGKGGVVGEGGKRLRNRDVLVEVYGTRSPFDRNVLGYLWSLFHHVLAVYTHAFSKERFHLLHQYNSSTPATDSTPKTFTRTTTSVTVPTALPPPSLTQVQSRRVHPLVIVGDSDELIAPQNSLTLAKYLRCACLIFKGGGHMVYVEHATVYGDVLHKHFRMAREGRVRGGWYEDDSIKVVDYTQGVGVERGRRLSTIAASLSSGRVGQVGEGKGDRRWRMTGWEAAVDVLLRVEAAVVAADVAGDEAGEVVGAERERGAEAHTDAVRAPALAPLVAFPDDHAVGSVIGRSAGGAIDSTDYCWGCARRRAPQRSSTFDDESFSRCRRGAGGDAVGVQ